jgi:hypothetical protein
MKTRIYLTQCFLAVALLLFVPAKMSAVTVGVDPGASWLGYMNVFELPSNGGGYVFGSSWGLADLSATFSGVNLTLAPNTIGDPNSFWYTPSGGPGATGNKTMDASIYVQNDGGFAGINLTFTGLVLNNTLVSPYTSVAFIKDFAPDYSSFNLTTAPLVNGVFSITHATVNDPARHVQYGFETVGPNVWITDVAAMGSVQITAVPEPAAATLIVGSLLLFAIRKPRKV